jgi:hypothetical protein
MPKRARSLTILFLVATRALCLAQEKPDQKEKRIWGYSHIGEYLPDGKDTRLEFGGVSQDLEHLVGAFVLARQRDGAPLVIHGHLNKSGDFTPNVSLEVSDQEDGNWKIIESSLSDKPDVTLTAAPHTGHLFLRIQFDALQPYVRKFKFFRVVLQTGESDVTPMTWLTEEGHP